MMNDYASRIWKDGGGYTHQDRMYFSHVLKYLKFGGGTVLEIGPGTGVFAGMMMKKFDISSYTVLDLERNIFDSVGHLKRLGFDVEHVFSRDYKTLLERSFDLVVSNVCIPETPKEYREKLLNGVIPRSNASMIIGQLRWEGSKFKGPDDGEYEEWIRGLFKGAFGEFDCVLTPYCNCHALIGEK